MEKNKIMEEQQAREDRFVILRWGVLQCKDLTPSEKLVYARICGFNKYFESKEECAEILGVSEETVIKAKQKLVKLGYIKELKNTGRGKIYQSVYDDFERVVKSTTQSSKKPPVRVVKSTNIEEIESKVESRYNVPKGTLVKTEKNETDNKKSLEVSKERKQPKPEIDELHDYWQLQIGYPITSKVQQNRYACNNLLKKFGVEGVQQLIRAVQGAQEDRYAPAISDFATLQAKLNDLLAWAKKKGNNGKIQHF